MMSRVGEIILWPCKNCGHENKEDLPKVSNNLADILNLAEDLENKIKSYVYQQYQFSPETLRKVNSVYKPFLEQILSYNGDDEIEVFTTNYDRVIEMFCAKNNFSLIDGFRHSNTEEFEWAADEFEKKGSGRTVKLYKLHGSLNWRRRYDDLPVKIGTEEKVANSKQFKENLLIYPAEKSKPEIEPFKTLYEKFEHYYKICDACIFIGFAFRDEYLNKIIDQGLENLKIMIIDLNAVDIRKSLIEKLGKKSHRIFGINASFEDANNLDKINEFLSKNAVIVETVGKGVVKINI
jgi:hypothetical protein